MGSIPSSLAALPPELATTVNAPRGVRAAREFEASLIASLLESMEKTFASVPGDPPLAGQDDYNYLGTQALASGIAARGGFGIAALIARSLAAHEGKG
jgi:Rod binding domain-containing protein